jgi:hypothetical protein
VRRGRVKWHGAGQGWAGLGWGGLGGGAECLSLLAARRLPSTPLRGAATRGGSGHKWRLKLTAQALLPGLMVGRFGLIDVHTLERRARGHGARFVRRAHRSPATAMITSAYPCQRSQHAMRAWNTGASEGMRCVARSSSTSSPPMVVASQDLREVPQPKR